jgi:hypothetical protein
VALFLLAHAGALLGQAHPQVEVIADLLETFPAATVTHCLSCEVRRPASADGVKQPGLFAHPAAPDRAARVEYSLALPNSSKQEVLLLAFDTALADGVKLGSGEDGVRFQIELDGRRSFVTEVKQTRWEAHALDLTPLAGRNVRLTLVTEAGGNTSYDWATWGGPRVLRFSSARPPNVETPGRISSDIVVGAVAIQNPARGGVKVRLKPTGAGTALEWSLPALQPGELSAPWSVRDFSFPGASGVALEWEPSDALSATNILLATYPARPQLARLSATRALIGVGDTVPVCVEVKNAGRGLLETGHWRVVLRADGHDLGAKTLPTLAPGAAWRSEWRWNAPAKARTSTLTARLESGSGLVAEEKQTAVEVVDRPERAATRSIENRHLRLEFVRHRGGFGFARVFARQTNGWAEVAVWRPLGRIISITEKGEQTLDVRPRPARVNKSGAGGSALELTGAARDADGVRWEMILHVALDPDRPLARLRYEWKAPKDRAVMALLGPNLYVGDGTTGDAKSWGLFPGLESLVGAEPSSNERDFAPNLADRRTPHPHKVTVPLMAVTIGPDSQAPPEAPGRFFTPDSLKDQPPLTAAPTLHAPRSTLHDPVTVALSWDPLQRWDGEHAFPSPRFSSPNSDEAMRNHRLALFLPSTPDFVKENADRAATPYSLQAGQTLTLEANLIVAPGPATLALREWLRDAGGLPRPNPWPRSFQEELDVCRAGFLKTVWDEKTEKWRHCIDWAPTHAPGFAALLWLDSHVATDPAARRQSRDRVDLAVRNMLRDGGAGLLSSQSACHILQWELPFLYGHLPQAMAAVDAQVRRLIQSQHPDGGWRYQPDNAQQADLGQAGDSVLGTCANRAATLLRYARITGDRAALEAGEKALRFMERFRVPRGGQTWECPMYEPDILAAAYAIRAYHDAWRVTGNPRWLHNAVYWAETGVPFVYLWSLPDKPMMLGATIPVFGSTFYTHSWLAVPVQWCGLVYAYHLWHLAEDLERVPLPPADSPLPLALNLFPADWKRVVELITVSAAWQQFGDGPRVGAYPDSISRFEQRNPAFLNPEDILVNVLALHSHDPDVKTARLKTARGEIVVSSGAGIEQLRASASELRFRLNYFAGEPSHALVAGVKPAEVKANGQPLPKSEQPLQREPGWWWDEQQQRCNLTIQHDQPAVEVTVTLR